MKELEVKAAVRERDGNACTKCGMTADEHRQKYGRTLDVHRLIPGSVYSLDGCVTLCRVCHGPEPRRGFRERLKQEPHASRVVGFSHDWAETIRRLAAKNRQPVLYMLIDLVKAEAERQGIVDLPAPPWDKLD